MLFFFYALLLEVTFSPYRPKGWKHLGHSEYILSESLMYFSLFNTSMHSDPFAGSLRLFFNCCYSHYFYCSTKIIKILMYRFLECKKKILVIKQLVNGWTKIIIDILTFNPLLTRYFSVISPAAENCAS